MTKLVSLFAAALLVLCGSMYADVFASRIKITNPNDGPFDGKFNDGTGIKVSYLLNDTATSVELKVYNAATNAVTASVVSSPQGRGLNSISWDGNGAVPGQKYYIMLRATQKPYSTSRYTPFYFQNTSSIPPFISRGIYTRGLGINNNMDTRGFGYWYASCADPGNNSGYKQGTLRYNPDGSFAGTDADHPLLTQTLSTGNGGTFDWGVVAPWTSVLDNKGRIYQVSNDGNFVTRMDNDSAVPKIIIRNIKAPRGIYIAGSGSDLKLYIAADTVVWRANIGNDDTLKTPLELIASFGLYVRDVVLDDAGAMLVTLRTAELTNPGYIERYDISGTLPKKRSDQGATFSLETTLGVPVCFEIKHGANKTDAADDTIYYAVRRITGTDTTTFGIHQLTGINGFVEEKQVYKNSDYPLSVGGNNRQDADIALDWGGNIVWFENGNEEIVMIATPSSETVVTRTTKGYDTISVSLSTAVGNTGVAPDEFALYQNFPNPFNPSTMISYSLPMNARVSVVVYDILGNAVSELYSGEAQQGYNAIMWNGSNSHGVQAASGMYLYRITAQLDDGRLFSDAKRMMLLK